MASPVRFAGRSYQLLLAAFTFSQDTVLARRTAGKEQNEFIFRIDL